ncbi:hypothetical protein H4W34_006894 [Actinomadura algeriensis]|uniref:Uncharacterized protein n=1 Tax=Actinomadura algeriensis TaxID=1679523 RepID=A0ABR9K3F4_9ACTN|nr:hypothetical protein [Actinomadura algeriensis]
MTQDTRDTRPCADGNGGTGEKLDKCAYVRRGRHPSAGEGESVRGLPSLRSSMGGKGASGCGWAG